MKSIRTYLSGACRMTLAVLMAVSLSFCSDSEGGESAGRNTVALDPQLTIRPSSDYYTALLLSGDEGTPWQAQIISGGDWVSFSRSSRVPSSSGVVGTELSSREVFVYYDANKTVKERRAEISFTFQGQEPVVLELVQFSTSDADDVYATGRNNSWPEIPEFRTSDNFRYVTHYAPMYNTFTGRNYTARDYTVCFDKTKRASWWVAYPLHKDHMGSIQRPNPDPWAFDPKIAADVQANITRRSYSAGTDGGSYDRGHQLPNADRNGISAMQYQTFYCSNSTPQNATLNQRGWVALEGMVRDWKCSDTLYVVTGAYWANDNITVTDNDGNRCPAPTNYFKVVVRTVKGDIRKTGDQLRDYDASQLQAIGFWVENKSATSFQKTWVRSVAEIETLTGFKFFPQVPAAVRQQKDPAAWNIN